MAHNMLTFELKHNFFCDIMVMSISKSLLAILVSFSRLENASEFATNLTANSILYSLILETIIKALKATTDVNCVVFLVY